MGKKSDCQSGGNALTVVGVDSGGNAYVTGNIGGTMRFNGGAIFLNCNIINDPFFAKISNDAGGFPHNPSERVLGAADMTWKPMQTAISLLRVIITVPLLSANETASGWYDAFVGKINSSGVWQWALQASMEVAVLTKGMTWPS